MGGEFGEECTHVCVWLSPFAVHLKQSQHCIVIPVLQYKISLKLKKKLSLSNGKGWGKKWGDGIVREFGKVMYRLLYLKWIPSRTYCTAHELCSMLCGSLDGRGVLGRMDTCICMAESLWYLPDTITTLHSNSYTPIQTNKIKKELGVPLEITC